MTQVASEVQTYFKYSLLRGYIEGNAVRVLTGIDPYHFFNIVGFKIERARRFYPRGSL